MRISPTIGRLACTTLIAIAIAGCANAPELQVALGAANEVPPNRSTAAGKASFWVHPDRTLNGIVETSGMDATAAKIYLDRPGAVDEVAVQLVRNSSEGPVAMEQAPVSGASWSIPRGARLSEEQYQAFLAGQTYINVHSARYPLGEIRGQIKP